MARKTVLQFSTGGGGKDFGALKKLISGYKREREMSLNNEYVELDQKEFIAHWRARGRSPDSCKRKWTKATSAKKCRKGWARKVGKKTLAWVLEPRRFKDADRFVAKLKKENNEMMISGAQASSMLVDKQGLQYGSQAKGMFGGVNSILVACQFCQWSTLLVILYYK